MAIYCTLCGANIAPVGRVHRCVPRADASAPSPNIDVSPNSPNKRREAAEPASDHGATTPGESRNARCRAKNRERYNSGMRELMRKRRAAAR